MPERQCGCEPVGQKEVAARLGVEEQTVRQWIARGIFPAPQPTTVGGRRWWKWADVESWAVQTGRLAA